MNYFRTFRKPTKHSDHYQKDGSAYSADANRWIFEMAEIASTYEAFGVTSHFHKGAGDIMQLANRTPLAAGTRETASDNLALSDVLQHYVDAMSQNERQTKK